MTPRIPSQKLTALVVEHDLSAASSLQEGFNSRGVRCFIARDFPTALLAMTQHIFDIAIASSRIAEEGDGWSLAGVLRMVFPDAFVAVIAPEATVLNLQAAINHGLTRLFEQSVPVSDIVDAVLTSMGPDAPEAAGKVN